VNRRRTVLLGLAMLGLASAARAQQIEIQPFIGYRFGGSFESDAPESSGFDIQEARSYGLTVGMLVNPNGQLDILWSHQGTSLNVHGTIPGLGDDLSGFDVDYYQIEGSYIHGFPEARVRPFVAFGAGATHFGAPTGFSGSRTQLAFSIGGGARVALGKTIGLRFQGRWTPTFTSEDETLFCSSGFGCIGTITGDFVSQIEVTSGLTVRF